MSAVIYSELDKTKVIAQFFTGFYDIKTDDLEVLSECQLKTAEITMRKNEIITSN